MKKTLIALSLAASLVVGSAMAQAQPEVVGGEMETSGVQAAAATGIGAAAHYFYLTGDANALALEEPSRANALVGALGLTNSAVIQVSDGDVHVLLRGLRSTPASHLTLAEAVSALQNVNVVAVIWPNKADAERFVIKNRLSMSALHRHADGRGYCVSLVDMVAPAEERPLVTEKRM